MFKVSSLFLCFYLLNQVYFVLGFQLQYFFDAIFFFSIKTNSSGLILDSVKALEIQTSMKVDLAFAKNTFFSCFCFFLLIIDLYFFTPAVITQMFPRFCLLIGFLLTQYLTNLIICQENQLFVFQLHLHLRHLHLLSFARYFRDLIILLISCIFFL